MKKIQSVFLILVIIFDFAGCSNTATNNGNVSSETSVVSENNSADEHNTIQTDSVKEATTVKK